MKIFMRGVFFSILIALQACTTTQTLETTNEFTVVERNAKVVLVEPDVELSFLKAAGVREARADWTKQGKANVLSSMKSFLAGSGHELVEYEISETNPRETQIVKLHEVVGATILNHRYLNVPLPTKKDVFDWSLGPGVQEIAPDLAADYALFLFARGEYASSGRQILALGLAAAGVGGLSTGGQAAYATLVDMKTGDIVWFNLAATGSGTDMRKPDGAERLVKSILKSNPLLAGE